MLSVSEWTELWEVTCLAWALFCCVSLDRVTWCWPCNRLVVRSLDSLHFGPYRGYWCLFNRKDTAHLTSLSISSVKCVSLSFGKLAKHYKFHSDTERTYSKEWKNVNIQCKTNHLSPQCLYLLLIPFICFLFQMLFFWLSTKSSSMSERVEVDFEIMDL